MFPHCVFPSPHPKPEDAQNLLGYKAGVRSEITREQHGATDKHGNNSNATIHTAKKGAQSYRTQRMNSDSRAKSSAQETRQWVWADFWRRKREHYLHIIILSLYWICYNITSVASVLGLLFFFLPWGMWDLSSQTRDWSLTPCIGRQSLRHWITKEVSLNLIVVIVVIFQSASRVQLSVTPWTVAHQTSLSFIIFLEFAQT